MKVMLGNFLNDFVMLCDDFGKLIHCFVNVKNPHQKITRHDCDDVSIF